MPLVSNVVVAPIVGGGDCEYPEALSYAWVNTDSVGYIGGCAPYEDV